jgi:hypothetical protein
MDWMDDRAKNSEPLVFGGLIDGPDQQDEDYKYDQLDREMDQEGEDLDEDNEQQDGSHPEQGSPDTRGKFHCACFLRINEFIGI